jgi:Cu/Zn superoxide dismutase
MKIVLYSALSSIVGPLLRLIQHCRPSRCFSQTDQPSTENQGNTRMLLIMFSIILAAGTGFAVAPSSASPAEMGVSQAQDQIQTQTHVQISDQAQNQSEPAIEIANQTTNGSVVTVQSVTLSQPGYVALHTDAYADGLVGPSESVIAISQYLSAGTHHNVTITISHAPPGNYPGLNRSRLNNSQQLVAEVYADSNGNHRFDFVQSLGENDTLVMYNGSVVKDSAYVRVPSPPPQTASVVFRNQTLQNNTLVVARARLPQGGFLVAHSAEYRRTGDPLTSTVGLSRYLPPGTYTNVSIQLLSGSISNTQIVTIRPSLDTNNNRQYDYVQSEGFKDVAYEMINRSGVIADSALVRVPGSSQSTPTQTPSTVQPRTQTPTTNSGTLPPTTAPPSSGGEDSDGFFGFEVWQIIVILVVVMGSVLVVRRVVAPNDRF